MEIHLGHLYPRSMNTYGDDGNIICLDKRCAWRNLKLIVHPLEVKTPIPKRIDIYFFGGGQDAAQANVSQDLLTKKAKRLQADVTAGIPLLAICGGYQLLGNAYHPFNQPVVPGVGIFPVETKASRDRMIGDLVIEANRRFDFPAEHQTIVGFENHSGKTVILDHSQAKPLGRVQAGFGNNGEDQTEGCLIHNAIGCYLHGSLLPKNPHLADWILSKALARLETGLILAPLDDSLEWDAHNYIVARYRDRSPSLA